MALRVTDGGARVGRARETYLRPTRRPRIETLCRGADRENTPASPNRPLLGRTYSVIGDAPRMTEGEGRPVAMKDDDSTSPSPADAPPLSALKTAR